MKKQPLAFGLVAFGVAVGATGIHLGDSDDAPGAALLGILLMIGAVALAEKIAAQVVTPASGGTDLRVRAEPKKPGLDSPRDD